MKEVIAYKIGDQIPDSAKYLDGAQVDGSFIFFYEIKIKEAKKTTIKNQDTSKAIASIVVEHLNQRTGKSFKSTSKETLLLIRSLVNNGFDQNDMMKAIDNMVAAWGDDPKWSAYLRPSTLFRASKFENYLNTTSSAQEAADAFSDLESYC